MRVKTVCLTIPIPRFVDRFLHLIQFPLIFVLPVVAWFARLYWTPRLDGYKLKKMEKRITNAFDMKRNIAEWWGY